MASHKMAVGRYAKYLTLPALVFCFCTQTPDSCGDGAQLDSRAQFCYDNKAWNKCGGSDTYNPDTVGCVFGVIKPRCGSSFYDPAGEFCHNDSVVYKKCNGQAFNPPLDCDGTAAVPSCDSSDPTKPCYGGTTYPTCGGAVYDPAKSTCNGTTVVGKATPPDSTVPSDTSTGKYAVTVTSAGVGATGAGSYAAGDTVTITAGAPPTGQRFSNWLATSGGITLANANKDTTTFVMPAKAVTVTAYFEAMPKFTVTVLSGTGGGSYEAGATVTVTAGAAPTGLQFNGWTSTNRNVVFADSTKTATTFDMPAANVAVWANFVFTDSRNSRKYRAVKIGTKMWMAENLNYQTASGSWCYNDSTSYCNTRGRLYNWTTAMSGAASSTADPSGVRGVCPEGWHLPSRVEWNNLVTAAGGQKEADMRLRTTTGWSTSSGGNGTDNYGFSARPGGIRRASDATFITINSDAAWWTATRIAGGTEDAFRRNIGYNSGTDGVAEIITTWNMGLSVRCVQN